MSFYTFSQNNSGGSFVVDAERGISTKVIIEASSAYEANEKAKEIGLYFDGEGDCDCCGNRWWPVEDLEGTARPSIYGKTPEEHYSNTGNMSWTRVGQADAYVHYADGCVDSYSFPR